ncbi:MAG: hypothetical protein QHG99_07920 [Methanomicrobiales archaeon]|nr:hypothetical protein [Methanomicrobiales archaeon]
MKKWALLAVIFVGGLLLWAEGGVPAFGDPSAPAYNYVAERYVREAYNETATINIVTAILADYRGYDTLGETTVIFTAGVAVLLLIRREGRL